VERLSHYQILEKLGEGGMGVVYKARDTRLERLVALKVITPEKALDRERRRRFVREAKAASSLSHPGIVTVHDADSEGDVDFIVMEYVKGQTLDALIPGKGMRIPQAVGLAAQIAGALAAAHAAGIVHRDLKPSNVMVTDGGLAKVLDFGLAKVREPEAPTPADPTRSLGATREGIVVGTCSYMSPEQAEGEPLDARSDVFSFGAVLYEMLTGRQAFRRTSQTATLHAVVSEEPQAPHELVKELPAELERIVLRCLRKDPAKRFQTMADLKVSLEEVGEESRTGRVAAAGRGAATRNRWIWAAAAAAVVGVLSAAVFLRRPPERRPPPPPVPLTSFEGLVSSPAISPGGNEVAFVWDGEQQDNLDVYVKLVGPGSPLRLTTSPAPEGSPAWSPDGRQIAFRRNPAGSPGAVLVIPALGGAERTIAEGDFGAGIAWSGDGQSLIVSLREKPGVAAALYVLSLATGELRRLTDPPQGPGAGDTWPALAPDGSLAFARRLLGTSGEIYLLPLDRQLRGSGPPRRLTFEDRISTQPTWTADGKRVVFSTAAFAYAPASDLMVIPVSASGQKAERLPGGDGGDSPSVSRQGRLVFTRRVRDENVWRLPLLPPSAPARFLFSTRRDQDPRFSADGTKIAFTSDRSGTPEVWLCDADGTNQTQLTWLGAKATGGARLSPDGETVALLSNASGQMEVYLVPTRGGAPRRLTDNPAHDTAPTWSRDGRWIYFASDREQGFQVWKMAPQPNAVPVRVTRNGGYAVFESVDGRTLYYARREGTAGFDHDALTEPWSLCSMPVGGGPETELLRRIAVWGSFDVTATGIYYVDLPTKGAKLRFHRFSDGSDTVLFPLEKRSTIGVSACPDDSCVLFAQYDVDANELMAMEDVR